MFLFAVQLAKKITLHVKKIGSLINMIDNTNIHFTMHVVSNIHFHFPHLKHTIVKAQKL